MFFSFVSFISTFSVLIFKKFETCSFHVTRVVIVSNIRVFFFLSYGGALRRGGDNAKSDWSHDFLKQRTCGHTHTIAHRNLLHWLFSCATQVRYRFADKAPTEKDKPMEKVTFCLCLILYLVTLGNKTPTKPFLFASNQWRLPLLKPRQ